MSDENIERFHRIFEEWYAHRRLGPDLLAADVEWVNPHDAVETGTRWFHSHSEILEAAGLSE